MLESLKTRPITTLPDAITFEGRILYLTVDPALVRSQLQGQDLAWTPDIPLRDDISTDEITPAYICYYYDQTLGDFPYLGLKCGEEFRSPAAPCAPAASWPRSAASGGAGISASSRPMPS
jgi:3-isopropylmalate/(R)-2-methylmalate dehydratase large subunit